MGSKRRCFCNLIPIVQYFVLNIVFKLQMFFFLIRGILYETE